VGFVVVFSVLVVAFVGFWAFTGYSFVWFVQKAFKEPKPVAPKSPRVFTEKELEARVNRAIIAARQPLKTSANLSRAEYQSLIGLPPSR
jgi:hypothetical protein